MINSLFSKIFSKLNITHNEWKGLALGQVLSLLITSTGTFSQLLATNYSVSLPTTQSLLNYLLLCTYLPVLYFQKKVIWKEFKWRIWIYFLFSIADVEANYLVVKAFNYTNITSIMLLDCFTIPCVMLLSRIFLKTRFHRNQFIGVALCLVGLIVLVLSDYFYNPRAQAKNPVLGDILCLIGSFLYSISNVGQEYLVNKHNRTEWLSMIGVFGSLVCSLQLVILEREELATIKWNIIVILLIVGFSVCLFIMYSLTPQMMQWGSATLFNLSLLTSDVFAIIVGVFLFGSEPSFLYFIAFIVIIIGLVIFNLKLEKTSKGEYQTIETQEENKEEGIKSIE